ncbi:esterase E4-like [Sitophilus oryzae]|uniref:Carboxylic ester hydrolase n=1 Tax=Sitophilus oryzae TaxID=7048 RepID=A0A6J2XSK1_SITOR|nr:esterase E4-like [Sitophilus oryzae]
MVDFIRILLILLLQYGVYGKGLVPTDKLNNDLQLTLQDGIIQGQEETTISNKTFYSYVGVPYAKPPINDLRFREPQPPEKWTGILDATVEGPFCAGVNISAMVKMEFKPQGEEDCLYLNVYTPRDPKESNPRNLLPVLVFYYGGAFLGGGPVKDRYGADFFMENDVIVVLPHFRISIFGYLSTEDLECPGNWAVKDQLAVLKWVQTNIKRFGGDPSRVTIAGQSAGAVSVNSLFMSPKAKGLFHRAVIMSGSSLCFWAYQTDSRKIAFDLGIALGIETNDTKYLMQELRKVDSNAIMEAQLPVMLVNFMSALTNGLPFTPVVEPDHDGAVLTNYTFSLLEKGKFNKVPVMTGVTSLEMLIYKKVFDMARPLLSLFDLSPGLLVRFTKNNQDRRTVGQKMKEYFLGNKNFADSTDRELMMLLTEDVYWRPVRKMAELISKYSPVYFYKFSYEGELGLTINSLFNGITDRPFRGVGHTEDTFYLFDIKAFPRNDKDLNMTRKLTKLYSNFIKYGNPTPNKESILDNVTWPKVIGKKVPFLEIDTKMKVVKENFDESNYQHWEYLYQTYGEKPFKVY